MKKTLAALALGLALTGCVATVGYEEPVLVNGYYVGYYNPSYGYWTGSNWDVQYYSYGHYGYGHRYYGRGEYHRGRDFDGRYHGGYRR